MVTNSEKNRTVGQNPSERNYHIFYQVCWHLKYFQSKWSRISWTNLSLKKVLTSTNKTIGRRVDKQIAIKLTKQTNRHYFQLLLGVQEPLKTKLCLDDPKNFRYVSGSVRDPNCEVGSLNTGFWLLKLC